MVAVAAVVLLGSCGSKGSSSAPPTGFTAVAGDGIVTLSWNATAGVNYWIFYAPSASSNCDPLAAGNTTIQNATSPRVFTGLTIGTVYSFSINGRTDGGPGGACTSVSVTPRLAGTASTSVPAPWVAGTALGANDLRGVTYNGAGSQYVAVGASGVMYTSSDGVAWRALNFVVGSNLNAVAYTGAFLAVGDGGVILWAADGTTWTQQTSGTANHLYSVASNRSNQNVAVGANGTILTSSDGKTWTAVASGTANHLYGVSYTSSGLWIAVGANGTLLTSTNGSTWTSVNSKTTLDLRAVTYGVSTATSAGLFVAVGASGALVTSPDGATWTAQPTISANTLSGISYGMQFIAVGAGGTILTSTNGTTWAAQPSTTASNLNAIVYAAAASRYSVVGAAGVNLLAQ